MKDFVKMVLAVMCGIFLIGVIGFFLLFSVIGAAAVSGSTTPSIPKTGVLRIDMANMTLGEQSTSANPLESIQGNSVQVIGLRDAVLAVEAAADDAGVQYIYLKTDGSQSSLASLYEFRQALKKFRASGKAIISYIETPTTGSYYLASVADKVYMTANPGATTMITGVSSQMVFLKDLLDKFGVNVQLIRHGKYKSAGEMYTKSEPSPENREQYQEMVNSMWTNLSSEIAESRGITVAQLDSLVDNLCLCVPQDFVDGGLVDSLYTREQLKNQLANLAVEEDFSKVKMIQFPDYVAAKVTPGKGSNKIAIVYADGEIIDGSAAKNVSGDRFAAMVEQVRQDSTIKAVVLRVNSPGGSVLASDKIRTEIDLLKAVKPVVASYGDYAASGGYWISSNCDKIFSDPVTLTGSIGCFGMVPDFSKTAKNFAHVNVTSISSNKHGDMYSLMRPFDQDEYNYMLRSIEDIYDNFITIVSEGRDIPKEQVDAIGQGRVWTGSDALGINLVDEIGTLEDAVDFAALAAFGDSDASLNVVSYPAPATTMQQIMSMVESTGTDDYSVFVEQAKNLRKAQIVARLPYEIRMK